MISRPMDGIFFAYKYWIQINDDAFAQETEGEL